jgi:thioredoxin reductase
MAKTAFDTIIIGGSYAGLSAALALGRSLRTVLVIDGGKPCNRFTPHSHNFLTQDGQAPAEIAMRARRDLENYKTVEFYEGQATTAIKNGNGFLVHTSTGTQFTGRKLILATGLKDIMPDIPGFAACWGKSVIHCPYCHGYEYAHEPTSVIGNDEHGYQYAGLLSNWTKELKIFTNGPCTITGEHLEKIQKNNIAIIESEIESIQHNDGQVKAIITKDGRSFSTTAVYNRPHHVQHSDIPEKLGCEITDTGLVKVDEFQKTSVDGVFACGDNSSKFRAVATAVYAGMFTGATVNTELIKEEF